MAPKAEGSPNVSSLQKYIYSGTVNRPSKSSPAPRRRTPSSAVSTSPPIPSISPTKRKHSAATEDDDTTASSQQPPLKLTTHAPSPKKKRKSSGYAPPSTYAHITNNLRDSILPNVITLFMGVNPGLETARSGHAYAHPSNLFWKLLFRSKCTPRPCRPTEDVDLPGLYALGFTNIVARPTRDASELSKEEMAEGVAILEEKCRRWRPESVCLVGKSIWETVFRVRKGRGIKKEEFKYGWQDERENMGIIKGGEGKRDDGNDEGWGGAKVFVATTTSGLAAGMKLAEKEAIWKELGDFVERRRRERGIPDKGMKEEG